MKNYHFSPPGLIFLIIFLATACVPPTPTPSPQPHQQLLPIQQNGEAEQAPTPISPQPSPTPGASKANADVEFVSVQRASDGSWTFRVTVRHPDTGWDDYADGWDVVLPDGSALKPDPQSPFTRLLLHPHENEQTFTRSQSGILIPPEVTRVTVRAHDLVDGWGGKTVTVDLSQTFGPGFEVQR